MKWREGGPTANLSLLRDLLPGPQPIRALVLVQDAWDSCSAAQVCAANFAAPAPRLRAATHAIVSAPRGFAERERRTRPAALGAGRGLLSARPSGRILHLTFLYFVITVWLPFLQRQCSPSFPCGYSLPALRLDRAGVNREARSKKSEQLPQIRFPDSTGESGG